MYKVVVAYLLLCIGFTVNAQTINLRGVVSNQTGKPIANAIVTLVKQGLKDTTGSDGSYLIAKSSVSVLPLLQPQSQTVFMDRGFLLFSLIKPSPVKVELFDVKGNLLKKELVQNAAAGFYRFNLTENFRASKLLVIKASIGQHAVQFRYLSLSNGNYVVNQSNGSSTPADPNIKITAVSAINDTIKTAATGYTAKSVAISNYDQALNITLDTAGTAVRSSGCGKTTTINGETRVTINAGAAGSRQYIIRLPTDYDPNTAYRLIFSIHCLNGTAAGVASGGANNNYQYYGLWKLANPANGKGTTIFCSPEGLPAMGSGLGWSQGANDLQFFRAMIAKFESELCIDQSRIFAEGFSMGGSQSYALACAMPDTFRAVCMHSGGSMSGCNSSKRGPIPMFITHGTNDNVCWWTQQYGQNQINDVARRDGCDTADLFALCKPTDQTGMTPVTYNYKNCRAGFPCKACIFVGGHDPSPGGEKNTWVDDSTWNYFKQF